MNARANKFVRTPADDAVDDLAALLQADAKRKRPLNPLQASQLAFDSAIDQIRVMVSGSPRALAEVRDQVERLRSREASE